MHVSCFILIEVMSDSTFDNRMGIRTTYNYIEILSERLIYVVYVINYDGTPLMPCSSVIARLLLKQGKAKCIKRTPFTIKLLYQTTNYTQDIAVGIDTGSGSIGSSAVKFNGDVIYLSEIEIRNDISDKMTQRAKYRRNRRNRKTRYRKERWINRKGSIRKDRFSPTMTSKINSHLKEINFISSILPISKLILETATFNTEALKNPEVLNNKWGYKKGVNYRFYNTRAYVLYRDNYTCQYCKGKSKDKRLHVHHIIFKSNNGSNEESNLITLCKTCHDSLHDGSVVLKGGKHKGQLKYATQMNSIRTQLLKALPLVKETFGFVTKEHRQVLNLPKEHYMDAVAIASQGNKIAFKTNGILFKKCISSGDYQQSKGVRSEQKIPTNKIQGFRKFDKVNYLGSEYFIKGRMSTGYAILMGADGKKIDIKPIPKFSKMKRVQARKTWIIFQRPIQSIA